MDKLTFISSLVFIVMVLLLAVGTVCWKSSEWLHKKHESSLITGIFFLVTFFVGAGLAGSALRLVSNTIAGVDCE